MDKYLKIPEYSTRFFFFFFFFCYLLPSHRFFYTHLNFRYQISNPRTVFLSSALCFFLIGLFVSSLFSYIFRSDSIQLIMSWIESDPMWYGNLLMPFSFGYCCDINVTLLLVCHFTSCLRNLLIMYVICIYLSIMFISMRILRCISTRGDWSMCRCRCWCASPVRISDKVDYWRIFGEILWVLMNL